MDDELMDTLLQFLDWKDIDIRNCGESYEMSEIWLESIREFKRE